MKTTIKQVKQGEFLRLKDSESAPVWVRGYYDKSSKTYELYKYEDTNKETFRKGSSVCFIGFEF